MRKSKSEEKIVSKKKKRGKEVATNKAAANKVEKKKREKKNLSVSIQKMSQKFFEGIKRSDISVVVIVLLLTCFGVAMVFSAGYYTTINMAEPDPYLYLKRQLFFGATGLIGMFIVSNIDYHIYSKFANQIIIGSIFLLVMVLLVGVNINGATRWIGVGFFRITPSEISKLAIIIFTATFLVKDPNNIRTAKGLGILAAVMIAHFGLVIMQPNLSTAIVLVVIAVAIMIVGGMKLIYLAIPMVSAVLGYFYIITFKKPMHWYVRMTSFGNPFADSQGDGYQVSQGLIALGNGGIKGMGFGKSLTKNLYLPEPQNDFILAIIGEELGFIGFIILMAAYILLLFRLILIALRAKDDLGFYISTGVAVMLAIQVIINVAVVTASMPATGITLPFISYGGTSIWIFMAGIGIALNVSKKKDKVPIRRGSR